MKTGGVDHRRAGRCSPAWSTPGATTARSTRSTSATGATLWTAATGGQDRRTAEPRPGHRRRRQHGRQGLRARRGQGAVRWAVDMKAPISGGATIAGTTIYVGVDPGVLHALSVTNGAERWNKDIAAGVGTAPAVSAGAVLVGGERKRLFSLSSAGQRNWVFDTLGPVASPVTPAAGTVYAGTSDGDLVALIESTGVIRWRLHDRLPGRAGDGGRRRRSSRAPPTTLVYAVDPASGEVRWDAATGGPVSGGAAVSGATVVRRQRRPVPPRHRRRRTAPSAGSSSPAVPSGPLPRSVTASSSSRRSPASSSASTPETCWWLGMASTALRPSLALAHWSWRFPRRQPHCSPTPDARIRAISTSRAGELQLHDVAELRGARWMAGEERRRVGRRLLDDVDALGHARPRWPPSRSWW